MAASISGVHGDGSEKLHAPSLTVSREVEERLFSLAMYEELGKRTEKNREEHLCPTRAAGQLPTL